jgi:hypothetical protein
MATVAVLGVRGHGLLGEQVAVLLHRFRARIRVVALRHLPRAFEQEGVRYAVLLVVASPEEQRRPRAVPLRSVSEAGGRPAQVAGLERLRLVQRTRTTRARRSRRAGGSARARRRSPGRRDPGPSGPRRAPRRGRRPLPARAPATRRPRSGTVLVMCDESSQWCPSSEEGFSPVEARCMKALGPSAGSPTRPSWIQPPLTGPRGTRYAAERFMKRSCGCCRSTSGCPS